MEADGLTVVREQHQEIMFVLVSVDSLTIVKRQRRSIVRSIDLRCRRNVCE